jgi:hypothetical protein
LQQGQEKEINRLGIFVAPSELGITYNRYHQGQFASLTAGWIWKFGSVTRGNPFTGQLIGRNNPPLFSLASKLKNAAIYAAVDNLHVEIVLARCPVMCQPVARKLAWEGSFVPISKTERGRFTPA